MIDYHELPKLADSISYLYVEHAILERESNAVVAIDAVGRIPIPTASVTCLLLGPGTSVTHAAVRVLADSGCLVVWCGEHAERYYASGMGETRSAAHLLHQARVCSDEASHLKAACKMYRMRFPGIDTVGMTLQQLRGMEGARVRQAYQDASIRTGVPWHGRAYSAGWNDSDAINRALSQANSLLYGICHAAIVSLGYSPGLGIIHTGKQLSFVYDVADLYKTETTIPASFDAVKSGETDLQRAVRVRCRDRFAERRILSRIATDIASVFDVDSDADAEVSDSGQLWDQELRTVQGGINYEQVDKQ